MGNKVLKSHHDLSAYTILKLATSHVRLETEQSESMTWNLQNLCALIYLCKSGEITLYVKLLFKLINLTL